MIPERLRIAAILWGLLPALAGSGFAKAEEPITRPHLDEAAGAQSVVLHGETFVNQGLVGAGRLRRSKRAYEPKKGGCKWEHAT